ncbi:MAG: hypothetical protein ACYCPV_03080, partial [Thermoplasmata archaeon]
MVGLLLLMSFGGNLAFGPSPGPGVSAASMTGASRGPSAPGAPASLPGSPAATTAVAGSSASKASASSAPIRCPTPQNAPNWDSASFFSDVLVSFSVPGEANLSQGNFQTVPCTNVLPTYLNGFWMNVTTNVPILAGFVTIWGTAWPTPSEAYPPLPGFSYQGTQVSLPMYVNPSAPES